MSHAERFFKSGLKLSHLRLLALFSSLGQIRLVAERLNISQPAVSKQLAELEAGVGAKVMVRVGNRLELTPVGETLTRRAREIFHQIEQARFEVDTLTSGLFGRLAIGAVATVLPVAAPEIVLEIKQRAPQVTVTLFEATSDRLFPMLEDGALDFALSRSGPPAVMAAKFAARALLNDPIVIVCGRDHPLADRRLVQPADLNGVPWILPPREAPVYLTLQAWLHSMGIEIPEGCVHSISHETNEALLRAYPFLGLMPTAAAKRGEARGSLRIVRVPDAIFLETVMLYYRRDADSELMRIALECFEILEDRLRTR